MGGSKEAITTSLAKEKEVEKVRMEYLELILKANEHDFYRGGELPFYLQLKLKQMEAEIKQYCPQFL